MGVSLLQLDEPVLIQSPIVHRSTSLPSSLFVQGNILPLQMASFVDFM